MKKYLKIFLIFSLQYFVYRLNFILWRVRNILGLIFIYFLWDTVFLKKTVFLSYTKEQVLSYVFLINILSSIVLTTRTADIANEILNGDLINYLLKPFSFFKMVGIKEIVDKSINFAFSLIEVVFLYFIFQPKIFLQTNFFAYLMFFLTLFLGVVISFLIALIISFIAFYSTDIWAPRFLFFVIVSLIAGTFFPLDILPNFLYHLILLTPFPYLVFFPAKIYLHGFSFNQLFPFFLSISWTIFLFFITKAIWRKGIKNYSSWGR